jgi:hypothetical protein
MDIERAFFLEAKVPTQVPNLSSLTVTQRAVLRSHC